VSRAPSPSPSGGGTSRCSPLLEDSRTSAPNSSLFPGGGRTTASGSHFELMYLAATSGGPPPSAPRPEPHSALAQISAIVLQVIPVIPLTAGSPKIRDNVPDLGA